MGCAYGRDHVSEEEATIQRGEDSLPLSKQPIEKVLAAFEAAGSGTFFAMPEYTRLKRELGLSKLTALQNELFQQFQRAEGYDRRQLLLLALLLCQGSTESRAKALFTLYGDATGLRLTEAQRMVEDMVTIAVSRTTILVDTTETLKTYLQRLDDRRAQACVDILQVCTAQRDLTSEAEFLTAFEQVEVSQLLTCKGIRTFVSGKAQTKQR